MDFESQRIIVFALLAFALSSPVLPLAKANSFITLDESDSARIKHLGKFEENAPRTWPTIWSQRSRLVVKAITQVTITVSRDGSILISRNHRDLLKVPSKLGPFTIDGKCPFRHSLLGFDNQHLVSIFPVDGVFYGQIGDNLAVVKQLCASEWLAILTDDKQSPNHFAVAAAAIVERGKDSDPSMKLFRAIHGDQISNLLERRAEDCCKPQHNIFGVEDPDYVDALAISHLSASWNLKKSLPAMQSVFRQAFQSLEAGKRYWGDIVGRLGICVADRMRAGDQVASHDYLKLGKYAGVNTLAVGSGYLAPIYQAPNDPVVLAAKRNLLQVVATGLLSLGPERSGTAIDVAASLVRSSLLEDAELREVLIKGLGNSSNVGTACVRRVNGLLRVNYEMGHGSGWVGIGKDHREIRPIGVRYPLSEGNLLAEQIRDSFHIEQKIPDFSLAWTEARARKGRERLASWLKSPKQTWLKICKNSFEREGWDATNAIQWY